MNKKEEQLQRLLDDPDAYFKDAWEKAYKQAVAERKAGHMPKTKLKYGR